jgi:type VI secretion system protein ImpJ
MLSLSRVVWREGMHLAQHHFQAQSRYVEESATLAMTSVFFKSYGLVALEVDSDAVRNGVVALRHARGVMPDGLPFQFPDESLPEPLELADRFSPTSDSHLVLLGIPAYRPDRPNCEIDGAKGGEPVRYRRATRSIADETTGRDAKEIDLAEKNFRLLLDADPTENLVTMPVARVRRDGAGNFEYDPDYIPPCLQIGASPRLMDLLARLVEILDQRAESMAQEREASHGGFSDFAAREVASFWLTHTIHSSLTPLRHHQQSRTLHPEQLFRELSRLGGALCTFGLNSHPRTLPLYDHDRLDECFGVLDRHVRSHLDLVLPSNSVVIALEAADPLTLDAENAQGLSAATFHTATIRDQRCFGEAEWFLAVRSSASGADVVSGVPRLTKLCSAEDIVKLVRRALPGPTLQPVPVPPSAIAPRLGAHYFRIERSGPAWEVIAKRRTLGVYVPDGIPDAALELAIVLGS